MMLVYNMPFTDALYKRFVGIDGSAYFIGGFGVTAVAADEMIVVPIRAGVGRASRRQSGLSEIHPRADLEPLLATPLPASLVQGSGNGLRMRYNGPSGA